MKKQNKKLTTKTNQKAGFNPQPDPPGRTSPIVINPIEIGGLINPNHNQNLR